MGSVHCTDLNLMHYIYALKYWTAADKTCIIIVNIKSVKRHMCNDVIKPKSLLQTSMFYTNTYEHLYIGKCLEKILTSDYLES